MLQGQARIGERVMQRAIDILAIKVSKTYSGGTYLSDFSAEDAMDMGEVSAEPPISGESSSTESPDVPADVPAEVPRLYANQRGRRAAVKDEQDLVAAFQAGGDVLEFLRGRGMVKECPVSC